MLWASVRARLCACTWMPATFFFVGMSCFSSSSAPSLGVCVHMHHVICFLIFKGKSLSWVHVCLCAQACVPRIFLGEGAFGGCMCMHARMTCTYCMDVCTLVEQLCSIQLLHIRAHAEQVLTGRLTFLFIVWFFFYIHQVSSFVGFVYPWGFACGVIIHFFNVSSFVSAVTH